MRLAAGLANKDPRVPLAGAVAEAVAEALAEMAVAGAMGARRCRYVEGCTKGSS